jgi:hypothetical protein
MWFRLPGRSIIVCDVAPEFCIEFDNSPNWRVFDTAPQSIKSERRFQIDSAAIQSGRGTENEKYYLRHRPCGRGGLRSAAFGIGVAIVPSKFSRESE